MKKLLTLEDIKEMVSFMGFCLGATFYLSIWFIFMAVWYSCFRWAWSVFFGG